MFLDGLEQFFNAQSDADWAWWPLLRLRPPKDVNFSARFFQCVFLGEIVVFGALLFVCVIALHGLDLGATLAYLQSPPGGALILCDLVFSLATSSPYYLFWNRRAERLRRTPPDEPEELARSDVWPPPPRIPTERSE